MRILHLGGLIGVLLLTTLLTGCSLFSPDDSLISTVEKQKVSQRDDVPPCLVNR